MTEDLVTKAIEDCIDHWMENLEAETPEQVSIGISDCALCNLFFWKACRDCPIRERTGREGCTHTPYEEASHAYNLWSDYPENKQYEREFKTACKHEIKFLEDL